MEGLKLKPLSAVALLPFLTASFSLSLSLSLLLSLSPPPLQINLKILLVDGSTHTFLLSPSTTGAEAAQYIHCNWPSGAGLY